ncbi:uncharacterized protein LOC110110090 [Dendrobium catenatum]|uniref:uncharacterized protein LOC110110090 n=1 Tax=Dendrobium catenatum TaxID=906689 RepID=UPI0009F24794|nr:uncharacterized protein LOC110110090 [Dendrobium catenatum]
MVDEDVAFVVDLQIPPSDPPSTFGKSDISKMKFKVRPLKINEPVLVAVKKSPLVLGKGKGIVIEDTERIIHKKTGFPTSVYDKEASSSSGMKLFVNRFSNNVVKPMVLDGVSFSSKLMENTLHARNNADERIEWRQGSDVQNLWTKKPNIKCNLLVDESFLSKDGKSIKLNESNMKTNSEKLQLSIVVKKVEYEKVSSFCFKCGKVGHLVDFCKDGREGRHDAPVNNSGMEKPSQPSQRVEDDSDKTYGPSILLKDLKRRKKMVHVKDAPDQSAKVAEVVHEVEDFPVKVVNTEEMIVKNELRDHSEDTEASGFLNSKINVPEDLWKGICQFISSGIMCEKWRETSVVLIPKLKNPMIPSNYRPINLCNSIYKIIARLLVNRLVCIIPKLILENQVDFIKGRSISENIMLTQEIINKFIFPKAKKSKMAINVDMEQAYDSTGWETLRKMLEIYGFPRTFSNLLLQCVVNTKYSIIINGYNTKWIRAECGFRLGCPLSPYLFSMCSQLLTEAFNKKGAKIGIKVVLSADRVSHLQYADAVIIFSEASQRSANKIKKIFEKYSYWTG